MVRKLLGLGIIAVLLGISSPAPGQDTEVRSTVERLLAALGRHDVPTLSEMFMKDAVFIVARVRDGVSTNSVERAAELIERMRKDPDPDHFEERLSNIEITVDSGEIAYLRADFEIVRAGTVVAAGVDVFTLLRDGEAWKVAAVAYTNLLKR